jgi:Skp family chaperone for outer membrane proteins
MMTFKTSLTLAVASAALIVALPASAQVAGIATSAPDQVILNAKAFGAANTQIATTYKAQLDQATAKQTALTTQIRTILDTNKDGQISNEEYQAGQVATSPLNGRVKAAEAAAQPAIDQLRAPAVKAQAYAIEQVGLKYDAALQAVVKAKNINLVLSPNAIQYAPPAIDVSKDVIAELDRQTPTVSTAAPADWQPSQDTVTLLQQYRQAVYMQEMRRAQAAQGAAPGAPAAAKPTKQPQGR